MAVHEASSALLLQISHSQTTLPTPSSTSAHPPRTTPLHLYQASRSYAPPQPYQTYSSFLRSSKTIVQWPTYWSWSLRHPAYGRQSRRTWPQSSSPHHQQSPSVSQPHTTQTQHPINSALPGPRRFHQALPTVAPYHYTTPQASCYPPAPPVTPPPGSCTQNSTIPTTQPPHLGGHPPFPAGSGGPPLRMPPSSNSTARSWYTHHQWPLHPHTGSTSPQHLSQRQHEQHLLSKQGSLLPHFPDSLHKMA